MFYFNVTYFLFSIHLNFPIPIQQCFSTFLIFYLTLLNSDPIWLLCIALWIIFLTSSCCNHFLSNINLFLNIIFIGFVSINTIIWSDAFVSKWIHLALSNSILHFAVQKTLSSLSLITFYFFFRPIHI